MLANASLVFKQPAGLTHKWTYIARALELSLDFYIAAKSGGLHTFFCSVYLNPNMGKQTHMRA